MKQKVIVYRKVPNDIIENLTSQFEVVYFERLHEGNYQEFLKELQTADGLLGASMKINQELLEMAPNLKIISNISVGYDNLDMNELRRRGIKATNTPGVLVDTTADTIFGLLLATARRIPELDHYVKKGEWSGTIGESLFGVDVHHKTLGIIGMGSIGRAIAKRGHFGFDMNILYHNRSRKEEIESEFSAEYCELDALLKNSDYVCLMTPYTPETDKMIGERELRLMKRSAIFINGSRGKNVDEQALIKALKEQWILAAGLDVYEQEPIAKENQLLTLPNVVTLPHIGSATKETRDKMARLAADNLIAGLTGNVPPNLIK